MFIRLATGLRQGLNLPRREAQDPCCVRILNFSECTTYTDRQKLSVISYTCVL